MDAIRRFGRDMAAALVSWRADVGCLADARAAEADRIEAEVGREIVLTAWMRLFATIGQGIAGERRG